VCIHNGALRSIVVQYDDVSWCAWRGCFESSFPRGTQYWKFERPISECGYIAFWIVDKVFSNMAQKLLTLHTLIVDDINHS
jgi:hypothetical protein